MTTRDSRLHGNDMFWDERIKTTPNSRFLLANFGYEVSHSSKLDGLPSDLRFPLANFGHRLSNK